MPSGLKIRIRKNIVEVGSNLPEEVNVSKLESLNRRVLCSALTIILFLSV